MKLFLYKRPFLYAAIFCVACSLSVITKNAIIIAVCIAAIVFILSFALVFLRGTVDFLPAVLICICSAVTLLSAFNVNVKYIKPADDLIGKSISIDCSVVDKTGESVYSVKSDELIKDAKFNLILYDDSYDIGDRLKVSGKIYTLDDVYRLHNVANGTYAVIYPDNIRLISKESNIFTYSECIRGYISECLYSNLSEDSAAFVKALVTGNDNDLSYLQSNDIRTSGVSHLVVVSGLHLGIICGSIYKLLRKLKVPTRVNCIITSFTILLVIFVCGLGFSVQRAVIVYLIFLIGRFFGILSNSLNSLSIAVCVIIMFSPYSIGSVSFLLSVSATFGLIVLSPKLESFIDYDKVKNRILNKSAKFVVKNTCIAVSAAITTMPILIYYFGGVSVISVVTNLLLTAVVTVVLCIAVIGITISLLHIPFLTYAIFFIVEILTKYCLSVIKMLGNNYYVDVNKGFWVVALIMVILVYVLINAITRYIELSKESEEVKNEN